MYVPSHFREDDPRRLHAIMRRHGFATLVTVDADGAPVVTHLPFVLDAERGPLGTLLGHVARANPHWRALEAGRPSLAIFVGPHAYVSPAWYADGPAVPTWNYVAVHAHGRARLVTDAARVHAHLARTVATYESAGWRMDALPEAYVAGMAKAIVAFELPIERLQGKAKLGQNKSAADRAGAVAALHAAGDPAAGALADLMATWAA